MPMPVCVRPARARDAAACAALYCDAARGGVATWAYMQQPPASSAADGGDADAAVVAARMRAQMESGLPFLLAESPAASPAAGAGAGAASAGGRFLGYACGAPFRPREGWRFAVENSVYVCADARRQGVGAALLAALLPAAAACGFRRVVAGVTVERGDGSGGESGGEYASASVRLHQAAGFDIVGRLPAVGWKGGRWLDAVFLQRSVGAGDECAPPDDALLPAELQVPAERRQ